MPNSTGRSTATQTHDGQVEKICECCTQKFWRYPNGSRGRFCSKTCLSASHKGPPIKPRSDPQTCRVCLLARPLSDYPINRGRPGLTCQNCKKKPAPGAERRRMLKKHYGMSLEDWVAMYHAQTGGCAICKKRLPELEQCMTTTDQEDGWQARDWNTDHCHVSGLVRGILCRKCNAGLGLFLDNPGNIRRAARYLSKHQGES
jgi:hypothetical protein